MLIGREICFSGERILVEVTEDKHSFGAFCKLTFP